MGVLDRESYVDKESPSLRKLAMRSPSDPKNLSCSQTNSSPTQLERKHSHSHLDIRLPFRRHSGQKIFMLLHDPISRDALLRTPRSTPLLHQDNTSPFACTTRVAVIDLPLDRIKTSGLKSESAKKIFAKFSTRQKYFVLVCRLFYFLKFS